MTDQELISHYKAEGETLYLNELFGRYIRYVFLICLRYLNNKQDAQDVSMQLFGKLPDDLKRFEVADFRKWLYVVCKNTCFMQLRIKKRNGQGVSIDTILNKPVMENLAMEHPVDNKETAWKLNQLELALQHLDGPQQQCVRLFYLDDKSYKEVAQVTNFTEKQVKSHIQNGKRNLKIWLERHGVYLLWILFVHCQLR